MIRCEVGYDIGIASTESGFRHALLRLKTFDGPTAVIAAALVVPAFLFAPLRIFALNEAEFPASLTDVARSLSLLAALLLVLSYTLGRLWPAVMRPAMTVLAVIAGLESALFFPLAGHAPFDGSTIDWSRWEGLSAVEIAAALAVCAVVALAERRRQIAAPAAVAILLFGALGLGSALQSRKGGTEIHQARHDHKYFSSFHRLSPDRNVVHMVLDTTQGAMVESLIAEDRDRYESLFDGFIRFSQAMGRYPSTYPSVPYYMTGRSIEPERDYVVSQPARGADFARDLRDHSIVTALARAGFRTFGYQCASLYCWAPYEACMSGDVFDGRGLEIDDTGAVVRRLLDVALFQTTPLVVRRHIYDDGNWWLRARPGDTRTYSAIVDAFVARAAVDSPAATYNYFHLAGAHGPLQFDEDCGYVGPQTVTNASQRRQARCALRQVERIVEILARLGVYDQTLIVVHGDHGTPGLPPARAAAAAGAEFLIGSASALLMIKPVNSRGRMRVSDAPATLGDIPATIADALGVEGSFPGASLLRLDASTTRERGFLDYDETNRAFSLQLLPNLRRYRVRGDLFDSRSWSVPDMSSAGEGRSALFMDDTAFDTYASGFGVLERQVKPARWIVAPHARVHLVFPTPGPMRLVIESFVPPSIPDQSVTVSVNGQIVGTLTGTTLSGRNTIDIPGDLARRPLNVVELTPAKSVTPPGDKRKLSMVLSYIGFEPAR